MFGDNQAVVSNSTIPSLNKRHNALAYHGVIEMISAKSPGYYWIDRKVFQKILKATTGTIVKYYIY
jgi:hypothetical protein